MTRNSQNSRPAETDPYVGGGRMDGRLSPAASLLRAPYGANNFCNLLLVSADCNFGCSSTGSGERNALALRLLLKSKVSLTFIHLLKYSRDAFPRISSKIS